MTESELAEIEARCAAATAGPWSYLQRRIGDKEIILEGRSNYLCEPLAIIPCDDVTSDSLRELMANAAFIAHARTDLPRLLAAYREAREKAAAFDALQSKQTP